MAHFAQLDQNNVVLQVIKVDNSHCLDQSGDESETVGIAYCQSLYPNTNWKQSSYNGNIRKNHAWVGFTYDEQRDAFIPPKRFASWVLNESNYYWYAPVARLDDDKIYDWDEATISWVEFVDSVL
jgi:hypothetical protein